MNQNRWTGELVRVRAWEPRDWEAQVRWHDDTQGDSRTGWPQLPHSEHRIREAALQHASHVPTDDSFQGIISLLDGSAVGVISAGDVDQRNGTFGVAYYVEPEHRRRGYATEAVLILMRFYFMERRYQKANISLYEFNNESRLLAERLGFQLEGRQRRMHFSNDRHWDWLRYGLTVEEFREKHPSWVDLAP